MKKFICTRTSAPGVTEKIWRNNIEPIDQDSLEYKYNDPTKYITGNNASTFIFNKDLLEEFPEYNAGWEVIITNTGLTCFYTPLIKDLKEENNFVIYDMFDKNDDISLSKIKPDISMLLEYNMFDQPVNVRKVNFKNNSFVPNYYYRSEGKNYLFLNFDDIDGCDLKDFYFSSENIEVDSIKFFYKPLFVFRIYNSDGTLKELNLEENKIKINQSLPVEKYSNGIYFVDLSKVNPGDNNLVSISLENCGDGYLEVI